MRGTVQEVAASDEHRLSQASLQRMLPQELTYNEVDPASDYRRRIEALAEEKLCLAGITPPSFTGDKSVGMLSPPSP